MKPLHIPQRLSKRVYAIVRRLEAYQRTWGFIAISEVQDEYSKIGKERREQLDVIG